jgi:AraC-like DNA-binding protein
VDRPSRLELSLDELNPKIISSHFFATGKNYPKGFKLKDRYVRDYELELITYSEGAMIINDKYYPVSAGDIILRRPGQYTQGIMPYICYYVSFELKGNVGRNAYAYSIDDEIEFQDYYLNPVLDHIPSITKASDADYYYRIFDTIFDNYVTPSEASAILTKSYILQLLYQLYIDNKNMLETNNVPMTAHHKTIKKVIEYIHQNLTSSLDLKELSQVSRLSPNYLHRIFTKEMGITVNNYITKTKLDKAKKMLLKTELSIADIAVECGFDNIPYFCHLFKKEINKTPGKFRAYYQNVNDENGI